MPKQLTVTWSQTEEFQHTFEVEDDFDSSDIDAVDELICDLENPELDQAFQGCTDRTITKQEEG